MRKRKMYLSVEDIAELFGLSVSFAYRVVEDNCEIPQEEGKEWFHA